MTILLLLGAALVSPGASAAQPPRTVLCFGDSITAGSQLPASEMASVWPALVEKQSDGKLRTINEGKGGRPTASVDELRAILAKLPAGTTIDVLVVALGTNDSRNISEQCVPKAVANVRQMIALARDRRPVPAVLLIGPPNLRKDTLGPTKPIADQRERKLRELNTAFETLCATPAASSSGSSAWFPQPAWCATAFIPTPQGTRRSPVRFLKRWQ